MESNNEAKEQQRRVFNFCAGPSALPVEVLSKVRDELLNYRGTTGFGVLEMSHRSPAFEDIIDRAEANLRTLLRIPDNYAVLFMQGGGTTQFAAVALNLLVRPAATTHLHHDPENALQSVPSRRADYIITGHWSKKAAEEALKFGSVNIVWDGSASGFTTKPSSPLRSLIGGNCATAAGPSASSYIYFCSNETINGVELDPDLDVDALFPMTHGGADDSVADADATEAPILVADMSSHFLSRRFSVKRYGLIFAGAQNFGIAGLTVVIVRKDLLSRSADNAGQMPLMLNYKVHNENRSLYNTPPTFAIYVAGLMLEWLLSRGGLDVVEQDNKRKSAKLYNAIDESNGFYVCPVEKSARSRMNVVFRIRAGDKKLEDAFSSEAATCGLVEIKGHRSVGGLRVSLYNGLEECAVDALLAFMKNFATKHANST